MNNKNSKMGTVKLLVLLLVVLLLSFQLIAKGKTESSYLLEKASLWGKYDTLVQKIKCPDVTSARIDFWFYGYKDYGYTKGRKFCKGEKSNAGYFTYVKPYWYGWKNLNKKKINVKKITSVDGKYSKLLQKIKCGGEKKFYKNFTEYGYKPRQFKKKDYVRWCGTFAKPGYYVYLYPHWYIYEKFNSKNKVPKSAIKDINYTFDELVQIIRCEKDKKNYGEVYHHGYWDQNRYYCNQQMTRKGYWFYVFPNWYIWNKREKRIHDETETYDNWPPK